MASGGRPDVVLDQGALDPLAPLSELEVLIVDCQTTGATPALGSVLEIGWCVTRASTPERDANAEAHRIALPPGARVSRYVRELTGLREPSDETAQLLPQDAWTRLRDAMPAGEPMPTAIHFARFELEFLRDWFERFERFERPGTLGEFPFDALCVHAIACRLYPDLARRNLRALAGFLGHGLHLERRALGHVQATAAIWRRLVSDLHERGVRHWPEVGEWLAAPVERTTPRKRSYPLPKERYRALPDAPGVYRFLRSNGDVLYVGKAARLRARVTSHFTKRTGATERALEMLTQVAEIEHTTTESALEAALLENELIKSLRPPYNVQLVQADRGAWFSSRDWASVAQRADASHVVGPLPSRFALRAWGAIGELLEGAPSDAARRAAAVGAKVAWAPDETSFAAGWATFAARVFGAAHSGPLSVPLEQELGAGDAVPLEQELGAGDAVPLEQERGAGDAVPLGQAPAPHLRRRDMLQAARARLFLLRDANGLAIEPEGSEGADDESIAEAPAPAPVFAWDPERVDRHLERSFVQAYQLARRAQWLCLLSHASVVFREPQAEQARVLRIEQAQVVEVRDAVDSADLDSDRDTVDSAGLDSVQHTDPLVPARRPPAASLREPPVPARRPPAASLRDAFDIASYDRLRVLTTELRRVLRDGGDVVVRFSRTRQLAPAAIRQVFRLI